MATGARMPTSRERENNRRRERRRRAIAAKIYAGLRMYGNYKLPKHCDNNEVLKALCSEAGWTVEPDGTIYRKGCKRPLERKDVVGGSLTGSPCSSYQSPCISYNPSPASSSFHSPAVTPYAGNLNSDPKSLIPWLKNLSSASSSASSSKLTQYFHMQGGSMSAPVTPPLSSPTAQSPRIKTDREDTYCAQAWGRQPYSSLHLSTPPSPARKIIPDSSWFASLQLSSGGPSSPTFSLTSPSPFGIKNGTMSPGSSRMWTPGQSGTCSPIPCPNDAQMMTGNVNEFAFGSNNTAGLVKAWEGEKIHEECGCDELELTLGNSHTKKFKFSSS